MDSISGTLPGRKLPWLIYEVVGTVILHPQALFRKLRMVIFATVTVGHYQPRTALRSMKCLVVLRPAIFAG